MIASLFFISGSSDVEKKFIRTCPVGVKSCFGAKGFYDRDDAKIENDICKFYSRMERIRTQFIYSVHLILINKEI